MTYIFCVTVVTMIVSSYELISYHFNGNNGIVPLLLGGLQQGRSASTLFSFPFFTLQTITPIPLAHHTNS